jgi:hypothetical protein
MDGKFVILIQLARIWPVIMRGVVSKKIPYNSMPRLVLPQWGRLIDVLFQLTKGDGYFGVTFLSIYFSFLFFFY